MYLCVDDAFNLGVHVQSQVLLIPVVLLHTNQTLVRKEGCTNLVCLREDSERGGGERKEHQRDFISVQLNY